MAANMKKLHERDLVGTQVVDYDETVDVKRLRQERLRRLQAEIARAELGALILFDPLNVRYALGVRTNEIFALRNKAFHVALVAQEGRPILYRASGLEPPVIDGTAEPRELHQFESWIAGSYRGEATRRWAKIMVDALKELGIESERIGLDGADAVTLQSLAAEGVAVEDALEPLWLARAIKTQDEIALIRQACAIADVALWEVQEAIRPGVTENELFAVLTYTNLRHNGERMDGKLLTAGGNTNPWATRIATSRMVRPGDLVAMDTDMAGPLGYFADVSRTYLCGDGQPNEEQQEAYRLAYDFLQKLIPLFTVGATFQEVAEGAPQVPPIYKANRYPLLAHGVGMSDEWPAIFFPDTSFTGYGNYPGTIEENMVISVESSFGRQGGREQVKLEEQLLITSNGPEVLSHAAFDWRFLQ